MDVPLLVCLLCVLTPAFHAKSYDGYKLLRFTPQNEKEVRLLATLVPDAEDGGISFWSEPRAIGESVDVLVSPEQVVNVTMFAEANHMSEPKVVIEDVQK